MRDLDRSRQRRAAAVLVVSHEGDEHGDYLVALLRKRGTETIRLSYDSAAHSEFCWQSDGRSIGFAELDDRSWAGIWRRAGTVPTIDVDPRYADFAAAEWRDAVEGALGAAQVHWLSSIGALRYAEQKLVQLATARRLGIRHPVTIVTNDPSAARRFAAARPTVIKPIRYGLVSEVPALMAWTRAIDPEELSTIDGPPVLIQERLFARYHLRIVTVGTAAFVSKLVARELDWRSHLDNHDKFIASADPVDTTVGRAAVRIASALDLGFSAQDWLVDLTGTPYFLDLNPNGQWLFVEPAWDGAIGVAIAARLEELARC